MNNEKHAAIYAACKLLEKSLEGESMTPGTRVDLSGKKITITFPEGTCVSRPKGGNGNGTTDCKNTQSLYGYAVWCMFLKRLKRFNQHNFVRKILMEVWQDVVRKGTTTEDELKRVDPELARFVEDLKKEPGPMKAQPTTRRLSRGEGDPQITFSKPRK